MMLKLPLQKQNLKSKKINRNYFICLMIILPNVYLLCSSFAKEANAKCLTGVVADCIKLPKSKYYDRIVLVNGCHETIEAAIRFADAELRGNWTTKAWFQLAPGQYSYVADSTADAFFVYAQSLESGKTWGANGTQFTIRGSDKTYGFAKVHTGRNWGTKRHYLNC